MVKEENKMKVILIGKTGAGKTSVAKELEKLGYSRIITDTTRPMREGEQNGIDYNFIEPKDFIDNIRKREYAEYDYFDTIYGRWYYGSRKEAYEREGDEYIVLTPNGVRSVLAATNDKNDICIVYIKVGEETLLERLKKRGDDPAEATRRLMADRNDFAEAEELANMVILDVLSPKQAAEFINKIIKEGNL